MSIFSFHWPAVISLVDRHYTSSVSKEHQHKDCIFRKYLTEIWHLHTNIPKQHTAISNIVVLFIYCGNIQRIILFYIFQMDEGFYSLGIWIISYNNKRPSKCEFQLSWNMLCPQRNLSE